LDKFWKGDELLASAKKIEVSESIDTLPSGTLLVVRRRRCVGVVLWI